MALSLRTRLLGVMTALAVLLALVGVGVVYAQDAPSLPPIQADRVLASTLESLARPVTISGDVQTRIDLGLPEVPSSLGGEGGPVAMIAGTQRFRVWHSPDGLRVAHVLDVSEQDLIVNRSEAWWWDAGDMKATKIAFADVGALAAAGPAAAWMVGDGDDRAAARAAAAAAAASDPLTASRQAMQALAPFASVSVEGTGEVAGRAVYDLQLTPRSQRTLIGRVDLAIDAESWLPLRFEVIARATSAVALSAGFTSVSYGSIDPSIFSFSPSAGADVVDGLSEARASVPLETPSADASAGGSGVRMLGEGFETRVAMPLTGRLPAEAEQLLPYAGPVLSVTVVQAGPDRWLLAGAVPLDVLQSDVSSLS